MNSEAEVRAAMLKTNEEARLMVLECYKDLDELRSDLAERRIRLDNIKAFEGDTEFVQFCEEEADDSHKTIEKFEKQLKKMDSDNRTTRKLIEDMFLNKTGVLV